MKVYCTILTEVYKYEDFTVFVFYIDNVLNEIDLTKDNDAYFCEVADFDTNNNFRSDISFINSAKEMQDFAEMLRHNKAKYMQYDTTETLAEKR
jgi:hypothetical protein